MALFQRRKRNDDNAGPKTPEAVVPEPSNVDAAAEAPAGEAVSPTTRAGARAAAERAAATGASAGSETVAAETDAADAADAAASDSPTPEAAAPAVNIALSTFRGVGAPAGAGLTAPEQTDGAAPSPYGQRRDVPPAEASTVTETVPGLRDNVLLRDALDSLGEDPTGPQLLNVLRQLMQGHVFLRVPAEARELLAKGEPMPLAVSTSPNGQQFVMLYSSGRALNQAAQQGDNLGTTAVAQPVAHAMKAVLGGTFQGVIIDHASSPARVVLPRELLQKAFDEADPSAGLKTLLAAPRTDDTADDVVRALRAAPLWVAVKSTPGETADEPERMGIAEGRTETGERYIEVFSHPLEVAALGRGDRAMPYAVANLARALRDHPEIDGVLIDPGAPWSRLGRDAVAPLLARAEGSTS